MTKSAKWYRVLTSAEDMLILNFTEIPIYALRLLLYPHDADQNIRTLKNGRVKINLGICRGKKNYDKRDAMLEKAHKRDIERQMKERSKY